MLVIRFVRKGVNKKPFYRIGIMEKRRDPYGKSLENLGTYNPKTKEAILNAERLNYWIEHGAQPSPTVHNLLVTKGIIKADKVRASKAQPGKKKQAQIDLAKAEAKKVEVKPEVKAEEKPAEAKVEVKVETPVVETKPEVKVEAPAPEVKAETPAPETKPEEVKA